MTSKNLEDLFIHELKDLYSAENQLIEALPAMAKAASTPELKKGFEEHLAQTKEHAQRIEQIFDGFGRKPGGVKCKGMEGLIKEGEEAIEDEDNGPVRDAALIAAAQRVEHYEIAGYGTARAYARHLGNDDAFHLLDRTLREEGMADQKLTEMAESGPHINQMAMKA